MLTLERIKEWMKKNHINRKEFADELGVSASSINNWLSGFAKIPPGRLALIEKMMYPERNAAPDVTIIDVLTIRLTPEDYEKCCAAAALEGMSLEEWARHVLKDKTQELLMRQQQVDAESASIPSA